MAILNLKLITPPAVEPVTLAQCLAHCRASSANDDGLFPLRIQAARELCERETHRAFFNQAWQLSLDHFPFWNPQSGTYPSSYRQDLWYFPYAWPGYVIKLPRPGLVSVTQISYLDVNQNPIVVDPATYYVDTTSEPGRVAPKPDIAWPYPAAYVPGSVQVQYVAGSYGDGVEVNTCPAKVCIAILLIVASMFENREADSPLTMKELPLGVDRLLASEVFQVLSYENN